jgi:hypothetical protein
LVFIRELIDMIVKKTDYVEQFLRASELSVRLPTRTWKPVTQRKIYVVLGLFMWKEEGHCVLV